MKKEYIDRESLLHKIRWADSVEDCIMTVRKMPSVDVMPNRYGGTWVKTDAYPHRVYCSTCFATLIPNEEYMIRWGIKYQFCPNCGGKMSEYDNENIPFASEIFKY